MVLLRDKCLELQEIQNLGIPAIIASTVKEKSTPKEFNFPIITTDNQCHRGNGSRASFKPRFSKFCLLWI